MKQSIILSAVALVAGSLVAADSKDEVKNAAKKLADAGGYSWKTTTDTGGAGGGGGGGARFRPGPTEGRMGKDGVALISMTRGENTTEAAVKGDKGAIKTDEGWKSFSELSGDGGGQPNRGAFMARTLRNFKAPAAEAEDLLGKVKEVKKAENAYTADLTEEGVKSLLTFGGMRRGGGGGGAEPPAPKDAKGSVKFWIKDGVLSKYEYNVQGKIVGREDREFEINRTTTVEIKDVGTTKVEVPEEAKKKLS
jgi:hypothetical protein